MQSTTTTKTTTYENKEVEDFIEGDYVNIKDNESRTLEFVANKTKLVDKTDFNGKPTKKVQFIVIDPDDPEQRERKFELSRKKAYSKDIQWA